MLRLLLCFCTYFAVVFSFEDQHAAETTIDHDDDLLVGAFNIRIFGRNKLKKDKVPEMLCKIIRRYDLLLVQEIRDSSQTAFAKLVQMVNEVDENYSEDDDVEPLYEFITGRRVGRSSSKEQYGFIYRTDKLTIHQMYERQDEYDVFEREPIVVRFKRTTEGGKQRSFTFIPMHAKPTDALEEMNNLVDVYDEAKRYFGPDAIIAGDLNADCSYVCKSCWDRCKLKRDERFKWIIHDESDTTVTRTNCAYDRIILAGNGVQMNSCCGRVFKFDDAFQLDQELAENVSDHYPVEFIIH